MASSVKTVFLSRVFYRRITHVFQYIFPFSIRFGCAMMTKIFVFPRIYRSGLPQKYILLESCRTSIFNSDECTHRYGCNQ